MRIAALVSIPNVLLVSAGLISVIEIGGRRVDVPSHELHATNEVWTPGDRGLLVVDGAFARASGLLSAGTPGAGAVAAMETR